MEYKELQADRVALAGGFLTTDGGKPPGKPHTVPYLWLIKTKKQVSYNKFSVGENCFKSTLSWVACIWMENKDFNLGWLSKG